MCIRDRDGCALRGPTRARPPGGRARWQRSAGGGRAGRAPSGPRRAGMSLRRATVRLARRRLVRSLGYRGDDPGRAFALGLIGIAIGEAVFTRLAVTYVTTQGSSPDLIHAIMPTIALLLAYTLAGPALLLAESARGQGSSLERVLEALPVSRSEARLQLWVPPLTVALACVALMVPPTVAALIAADVAAGAAVLAVTATLVVAAATAAVLLMVAKVVLRGPRWASVHLSLIH